MFVIYFKHVYGSSSSSNFIPNIIQQYNIVCMTNITNSRVIIDVLLNENGEDKI